LNKRRKGIVQNSILEEISVLKNCLHEVSRQVDSLSHPCLVQISQMLDQRLNKYRRLSTTYSAYFRSVEMK
jgi:hypothetical protein